MIRCLPMDNMPKFEMSGASKAPAAPHPDFSWREYLPDWLAKVYSEEMVPEDAQEFAHQMETIAELAKTEHLDFAAPDSESSEDIEMLHEEGIITAQELERRKRVSSDKSAPLVRMAEWGFQKGIITGKEFQKIADWLRP